MLLLFSFFLVIFAYIVDLCVLLKYTFLVCSFGFFWNMAPSFPVYTFKSSHYYHAYRERIDRHRNNIHLAAMLVRRVDE